MLRGVIKMKKLMVKKNNKQGFTLVEIIVVLVILVILAAILIPSMVGYIKKANEKKDLTEARNVLLACQTYGTEHYDVIKIGDNAVSGISTSAKEGTPAKEIADLAEMPDDWTAVVGYYPSTKQVGILAITTSDKIIKYAPKDVGNVKAGWTVKDK